MKVIYWVKKHLLGSLISFGAVIGGAGLRFSGWDVKIWRFLFIDKLPFSIEKGWILLIITSLFLWLIFITAYLIFMKNQAGNKIKPTILPPRHFGNHGTHSLITAKVIDKIKWNISIENVIDPNTNSEAELFIKHISIAKLPLCAECDATCYRFRPNEYESYVYHCPDVKEHTGIVANSVVERSSKIALTSTEGDIRRNFDKYWDSYKAVVN